MPKSVPLTALLLFALAVPAASHAQATAETVRGRVIDDSGKAVVAAAVTITRGPDRLVKTTTTDSTGNYRVTFDEGTGDYLVHVAAPTLRAARRRVQRQADERELVANFTLAVDIAALAAVNVQATRPVRASNNVNPTQLDPGASEKWSDGTSGQISPTVAGDLNAVAGTMSNITLGPNGPSVLGSGAGSNLSTLNGMGFAGGNIPRAAHTETRVTGATFDAARGGFSGANVDVRLGPGSRQYQRRNGFVTFDPPALQYTDATTRSLGTTLGGFRSSFGADGELIRRALTYNVAVDVARSSSEPATLIDADADALLRAGVAPDSVARVIALAGPLGIVTGPNVPADRRRDGVTWLGRLDDTRDTLQTRALTTYVGYTTDGALGFNPLMAPAASGERRERTLGSQLTFGTYFGPGRRALTEARLAASTVRTEVTPYRAIPGASVLVRSVGLDAAQDVSGITLGGGSSLASDDRRWILEGSDETLWNARGRRHRFKALISGRADGMRQDGGSNRLGTFGYPSIEALQTNAPNTFTRTLGQPVREGSVWNAAAAFSHQYAPTRFFSFLYGARIEADGFSEAPARNPALEQALGVRTGVAPSRLHVSPRVGFTFQYNRDRDNGSGTMQNNVGRFYRYSTGTIRGGIGEFRDLLAPGILADASAATGLPGGTLSLSCVGSAVPVPDWPGYLADPASIPSQCLGGSGVLAERAPSVTLIDPSYDTPRSWRSSLDWTTNVRTWLIRLGGLASYDLSQPGVVDANFGGTRQLTLAGEGNRPVFVSAAAIDTASGAVSAAEARRSSQFGRVGVRVSDLRGYGGQLTLGVSPDPFKFRSRFQFFASAGYTLQASRRQYRGFDGAAFGDPRELEWAPSASDARHVVVFTGGFSHRKTGSVTFFSRVQSGLPFTPIAQGDVNGDGRGGDRAFIPDPATVSDAQLANGLRTLLASGSEVARRCVSENLGRVVPRNGCRGPWTQSLNVQWSPQLPRRWARRVTPNVYLQNVLAGVDQLAHGSASLRGWGSPATPDPVLLVPRGFDASASRFRYDVNSRFADTRPGRTLLRDPFRLVIDFSVNLSTNFDLQQLRRAVEPVRVPQAKGGGWMRRDADSLTAFYLRNTSSVHKMLLEEADSLFLSGRQILALRRADSVFSQRVRAVYGQLGAFLAQRGGAAGKAELDSAQKTQKEYWTIFWAQPEVADSIITPAQRQLMPTLMGMLATPQESRKNSQWQFGHPVTLVDRPRAAP